MSLPSTVCSCSPKALFEVLRSSAVPLPGPSPEPQLLQLCRCQPANSLLTPSLLPRSANASRPSLCFEHLPSFHLCASVIGMFLACQIIPAASVRRGERQSGFADVLAGGGTALSTGATWGVNRKMEELCQLSTPLSFKP